MLNKQDAQHKAVKLFHTKSLSKREMCGKNLAKRFWCCKLEVFAICNYYSHSISCSLFNFPFIMKYLVSAAILAAVAFVTPSYAQKAASGSGTFKIGVVDSQKIVAQLPEAKEAQEKLQESGKKYRDTLETIQKDYLQALEGYDKQKAMMAADAKTKEEERLKAIQERFMRYREEKLGNQGELAALQEELLAPIRKRVQAAIKDVAKTEKLSAVMETPAFVYFDEELDITFRVLDKLKRNK
jgi:outer membrane protein